jgi:hypothetical protein
MADLIEVAELDSGKREPQLERLHSVFRAGGGAQPDDGRGLRQVDPKMEIGRLRISRTFKRTGGR